MREVVLREDAAQLRGAQDSCSRSCACRRGSWTLAVSIRNKEFFLRIGAGLTKE